MTAAGRERRIAWSARLGTVLIRVLASTWRVRFANPALLKAAQEKTGVAIFALWHGHLLPLLWAHRNRDIAIMVSEHKDGEIITRIALALGFRAVRGSTSRGAARALLGGCRELESGHDLAVTPDGPRGPARSVAPGTTAIAQRTGAGIAPVAVHASRAWRLNSWDGFIIPKPFARVTVAYSDPIFVAAALPREATQETANLRAGIDRAGEIAATQ
ncbi:MAG TPA: lysophospholipid acyltransferase family protein [Gemmatimonadaceae bacterium]|nr:lysophospholipid acyltransferase family protein [Gemmatimonadaceae bacterium]